MYDLSPSLEGSELAKRSSSHDPDKELDGFCSKLAASSSLYVSPFG